MSWIFKENNTAAKIATNDAPRNLSDADSKFTAVDGDIFNLPRFVAKRCQRCTDNFYFWVTVALCALFEPIICSKYPTPIVLMIQLIILSLSTILYAIQLIGVASKEWEKIHEMQLSLEANLMPIIKIKDMKFLKMVIFLVNEEEYLFEFMCLLLGWVLIFPYPGIAVLRCFRVFRLLWFYEVKVFRTATLYYLNPILGRHFVTRVFSVLKFAIKAITALIDEMLRIGHRTRGGIILIMMLFYTSYVMGVALWIETSGQSEFCDSIGSCTFTLMRLTFFDGNGFDFAYFLTIKHRGLFCIVMFYLVLTSFGILNGLVGIFGNVFANASEQAFGNMEENEMNDYDDDEEEFQQQQQVEEEDIDQIPLQEYGDPIYGDNSSNISGNNNIAGFSFNTQQDMKNNINSNGTGHGKYDKFTDIELRYSPKHSSDIGNISREKSDESLDEDNVVPFTMDMSLKLPPLSNNDKNKIHPITNITNNNTHHTNNIPSNSPTKSDIPTNTIQTKQQYKKKPTYGDLKQLLRLHQHVKQKKTTNIGATAGLFMQQGGNNYHNTSNIASTTNKSPSQPVRTNNHNNNGRTGSHINLFSITSQEIAQNRKQSSQNMKNSEDSMNNQVIREELQQLREEMRNMMQMQISLQNQLTTIITNSSANSTNSSNNTGANIGMGISDNRAVESQADDMTMRPISP